MGWRNTERHYGLLSILLHWVMAILIISLLAIGLYMTSLPDGDEKWEWYSLHKSLGVTVFILLIIRLIWRSQNIKPRMTCLLKPYERILAHTTHFLLYLGMIIMPISGYVDSSAGGYKLAWFGLKIPLVIPENETLLEISVAVHAITGYIMIGLITMHLVGVLKHHFILKDPVIKRMLP